MSKSVFIDEARAALAPVVTSAKEQSKGRLPCVLPSPPRGGQEAPGRLKRGPAGARGSSRGGSG